MHDYNMRVVRGPEAEEAIRAELLPASCVCDARTFLASNGPLFDRLLPWLLGFAILVTLLFLADRLRVWTLRRARRKKTE